MRRASLALLIPLAGCASPASNIGVWQISPAAYAGMDCFMLAREAQIINEMVSNRSWEQDFTAAFDVAAVGVGLFVYWPILLDLQGDGALAGDLGELRGRAVAIEAAARAKHCTPMRVEKTGPFSSRLVPA